jgi:hypothetical protein
VKISSNDSQKEIFSISKSVFKSLQTEADVLVAEFVLSACSLMFLDRWRTEAEQSGAG